ncbi:MAG: hypothetical protein OK456_07830 [Thaumarchaeota archaeon]|nr:hypothetical protein [Nitrososphaerota archaeon]
MRSCLQEACTALQQHDTQFAHMLGTLQDAHDSGAHPHASQLEADMRLKIPVTLGRSLLI